MEQSAIIAFRDLVFRGLEIQRRNQARIDHRAAIPDWIRAQTTEELGALWESPQGEEWCDEIWHELNYRGRGDLCPI